jgi:hypothetical protein
MNNKLATFDRPTMVKFWGQWVSINVFCLAISFALAGMLKDLEGRSHSYFGTNSPNIIDCVAIGLILGVAQWQSLKRLISGLSSRWILSSLIALPVSVSVSLSTDKLLIWLYFFNHPSSIGFSMLLLIAAGFLGGIVGGIIAGLVQQAVLKHQVQPVNLFVLLLTNILGSAIGWAASWGAAFYAGYLAISFYQTENQFIELAMLGAILGLVNGAIVGGGLIWVLRRPSSVV